LRYKRVVLLIPMMALTLSLRDSEVFGQRRGGVAAGAVGGRVVGPYGGSASGFQSRGAVVGPGGRSASGGVSSGSRTTPGGASIDYAGAGRRVSGPGGAAAGGAGAVQVTTKTGQTYTKAGRAGGAVGPGGNAVGGRSSIGVASGPGGTAVGASRGGAVRGPGGVAAGGSRGGVALGPGGAVAGGARWGTAAGPYGLAGYSARGVAVGHRTYFVRPGQLPVYGAAVRRNFVHYNVFTPAWYRSYPNAWRAAAWTAATFWAGTTWAALSSSYGYPAQPVVYDYGSTIVYEGDQVIYNGEPVATAEEYTQQAIQIAAQGVEAKPADKEEWTPLGVFGMVQGDEQDANKIFQLAINKDGILRGNYYDALSDTTVPVYGAVDKKTQRAAWTVGDRKDTVYETGIGNLTEPETTILVHFGKDRTQQWTLVRLEKPQGQE
jgi:hypothetical protein